MQLVKESVLNSTITVIINTGKIMRRPIADDTFVLGIGAQKAGTTWLFDYFRKHDAVYVSSLKEMHYFDEVYRPDLCSGQSKRFAAVLLKSSADDSNGDHLFPDRPAIPDLLDRLEMKKGGDLAYVDYFQNRVPNAIKFFCEITPAYSLLPEEGFRAIKYLFPKTKLIFIMRDPIERYYSALKMDERAGVVDAKRDFEDRLQSPGYYERGRYDLTIGKVLKVFDRENVFFGFYETLFTEKEMMRLTDFLGIDYLAPDFSKRLNSSTQAGALSKKEITLAREIYQPVYEYCTAFFGSDLPRTWHLDI